MQIADITYALGSVSETLDDLGRDNPDWDTDQLLEKTGIAVRHICTPEETAMKLAERAGLELVERVDREAIDGLIYVTQSPDSNIPTNACILHRTLGLDTNCLAFDLNQGCSGFVYALSLAAPLIRDGTLTNSLIVCAETYSKYISPHDRTCRPIFSDGASAILVTRSGKGDVGPFVFATDGAGAADLMIAPNPVVGEPTGGSSGDDPTLCMNGPKVLQFAMREVPRQVRRLLEKADLSVENVDLFIFHQASAIVLNNLKRLLKLDEDRVFWHLREVGNTVSSTIPIAYEMARREDRIQAGMTVALVAFGVGYSLSCCIVRT